MNQKGNKQIDIKTVEDALLDREVIDDRFDKLLRQFNTIEKLKKDYEQKVKNSTKMLKDYQTQIEDSIKEANKSLREFKKKEEGINQELSDVMLRHSIGEINDKESADKEAALKKEIGNIKRQMSEALQKRKKYADLSEKIKDLNLDYSDIATDINEDEINEALDALGDTETKEEKENIVEEKNKDIPVVDAKKQDKEDKKKESQEFDIMDEIEELESEEVAEVTCSVCGEKNILDDNKEMRCKKCGADLL
ncbi:MAG: hypothetical protein JXA60_08570 [Candidatus Coatesbacteria bacterium]|nr:hypothetical protein [Candidatus Coatesbacteria bacterium]